LGGGKKGGGGKAEVLKVVGGLVNTLGWLWRSGRPLPKKLAQAAPAEDDEEEEEVDDEPVRSLPAFVVVNLTPPGTLDFRKTGEKRNHATFEVASDLRVGDFRDQLSDFFSEWQAFKTEPSEAWAEEAAPAQAPVPKAKGKKGKKGKGKGPEEEVVKLTAPRPLRVVTGRKVWSDYTSLAEIVRFAGCGGGFSTGDGEAWQPQLPWSGHGPELFRYGPVVVVLGSAVLETLPRDPEAALAANQADGSSNANPNASVAAKAEAHALARAPLPIRSTGHWGDAGGRTVLVTERPMHMVPRPVDARTAPTPVGAAAAAKATAKAAAAAAWVRRKNGQVAPEPAWASEKRSSLAPGTSGSGYRPIARPDGVRPLHLLGVGGAARGSLRDRGLELPGENERPSTYMQ